MLIEFCIFIFLTIVEVIAAFIMKKIAPESFKCYLVYLLFIFLIMLFIYRPWRVF